MEVYMDDITVYGGDFEECLTNLESILQRFIEKNLVLNWEKFHFMVNQGIVLGHVISSRGIEVDKAKIELISKLSSLINVKQLGNSLAMQAFIEDSSKTFRRLLSPFISCWRRMLNLFGKENARRALKS